MSQDSQRTLGAGNHTLRIVADATNRVTESNESDNAYERTFAWADCGRPTTTITSPSNGARVASREVLLTGTCTDPGGNLSEVYLLNTTNGLWTRDSRVSGYSSSWGDDYLPLAVGSNTIRATCRDPIGDGSTATITVIYNNRPTATINSPSDGSEVNLSPFGVSWTCSDGDGNLSSASLRNETTGWSSGNINISGSPYTYTSTTDIPLAYGSNTLSLTCTDTLGEQAPRSIQVNYHSSDLVLGGDVSITTDAVEGTIRQTNQFTIRNQGDRDLTYSFNPPASWVTLTKNGGETDGLSQSHTLTSGRTDTFAVALNSAGLTPGVNNTAVQVSSNDGSNGRPNVSVDLNVIRPDYCSTSPCSVPTSQIVGSAPTAVQMESEPVSTATGNYSYHHTDLSLAGRGLALSFARTYNSQDKYLGPLGIGWTHSFNIFLVEAGDRSVTIKWGDGHAEKYVRREDGSYSRPSGVFSTLTRLGDGSFNLVTKGQTLFRFWAAGQPAAGQLRDITDRKGNIITLTHDGQGHLTTVTDGVGRSLTFAYENPGDTFKLTRVTDSLGRSVQVQYAGNRLGLFTDAMGQVFNYGYDPVTDNLTQVTDPSGNTVVQNTYDSLSRITQQRDSLNHLTEFQYEVGGTAGHVRIIDPLRQDRLQVYDGSLRIVQSEDPLGRAVAYNYDPVLVDRFPRGVTDRDGRQLSATYDSRGNLTSLTDPLSAVTRFDYDPVTDDLTQVTLPNSHQRNFTYDGAGNLTRVSETVNGVPVETNYTYNAFGQVTGVTDPERDITTFTYNNATGNLQSVTDPEAGITQFTYDAAGRLQMVTDPVGRTVRYQYNANDQITDLTDPENRTIHYDYDPNGNVTGVVDRNSNRTTLTWNPNDFLETITDAMLGITRFNYDEMNRTRDVTDAEGRTIGFTYNAQGNLESITDPLRRRIEFHYDFEGNPTSKVDAAGQTWTYRNDPLGRPSDVIDPLGNTTHYDFNPVTGTLTQITDAENRVTHFNYDEIGRLTSVVDPLNQTTSYEYDRAGRLTALVNAARNRTTFTYDRTGRLSTQVNALGETEQYFYNLAGDLNRFVDGIGQETIYNYDPTSGRLSSIDYADRSRVSYTYDPNGNRQTRADALGTSTFVYDALSRLTSLQEARGFNIGYRYDRTGLLNQLNYPGGRSVRYAYNPSGQLQSLTDWLGNATGYSYDPAGRLGQVSYPNGFQTAYGYDISSRPTNLTNRKADGSILSSYQFTLDRIGNRTQVLKDEPLIPQILGENVSANYNQENELLSMAASLFDYDFNGSLSTVTAAGVPTNYDFDAKDQLSSVTGPLGATAFAYDGDGNRVSLTAGGQTTEFVVDPNRSLPDVIAEADGAGAIQNYYLYGLGLVAKASADGSEIHYYHYDPIGSTIALSDASGAVTDQYLYDEFGRLNRTTGNTPNPFQYVGRFGVQRDPTGLNFMRARYYDPQAGRFISRDPIGFAGGMNLYGYTGNNPISMIDPAGLQVSIAGASPYCFPSMLNMSFMSLSSPCGQITPQEFASQFEENVVKPVNILTDIVQWVEPKANFGPIKEIAGPIGTATSFFGEYSRSNQSVYQITSNPNYHDAVKVLAGPAELPFMGFRMAERKVTGATKLLIGVAEVTAPLNPAAWIVWLSGGDPYKYLKKGREILNRMDDIINGITASNLLSTVDNFLNGSSTPNVLNKTIAQECPYYSGTCQNVGADYLGHLTKTLDLSGGVTPKGKQ